MRPLNNLLITEILKFRGQLYHKFIEMLKLIATMEKVWLKDKVSIKVCIHSNKFKALVFI